MLTNLPFENPDHYSSAMVLMTLSMYPAMVVPGLDPKAWVFVVNDGSTKFMNPATYKDAGNEL